MEPLDPATRDIPHEVLAVRVEGRNHLHYELDDGSFLTIAGSPKGADLTQCRRNIAGLSQEALSEAVREPRTTRAKVGISNACSLLLVGRPVPGVPLIRQGAAKLMSDAIFGSHDHVPALKPLVEGAELQPEPVTEPVTEVEDEEPADEEPEAPAPVSG